MSQKEHDRAKAWRLSRAFKGDSMCDDNGWTEYALQENMLVALCERLDAANLAALIAEDESLLRWWTAHKAEKRRDALHREVMRVWQQRVFQYNLGGPPPAYLRG